MNFLVPCKRTTVAVTAVSAVCAAIASTVLYRRAHRKSVEDSDLFEGIVGSPHYEATVTCRSKPLSKEEYDTPGGLAECNGDAAPVLIAEREAGLQLARDLLKQLHADEGIDIGVEDEKLKDDDSDETNVSLNYHIATELEEEARNSLIEAVVAGEVMKTSIGPGVQLSDFVDVLGRAVEYLDISNEREKLRARRSAAALDERISPWPVNTQLGRQRLGADFFSHVSEMEERLGVPLPYDAEERFEMRWDEGGADDSHDDEAELMEYLDQNDSAGYGSRTEARLAAMMDNNMLLPEGVDEDAYYGYDEADEEEGEEEKDDMLAKAEFERMVLDKLQQLAIFAKMSAPHQPSTSAARDVVDGDGDEEGEWDTEAEEEEN